MPGFVDWLSVRRESEISEMLGTRSVRTLKADTSGPASLAGEDLIAWMRQPGTDSDSEGARRELGERLGAFYLARSFNKVKQPLDPVARFHLGNGARIERLNWRADNSVKGIRESLGLMVNYQYLIAELDDNLVRLSQGEPRLGRSVSRLLAR